MDTPGDPRPRVAKVRATKVRAATVAIAGVAAVLLVGLAIRAAGEPSAAADTPVPVASATPSAASLVLPTPSPSATAMLPPAQAVLVLGDSLALSTYPWLADLMPDRPVSWAAQVGRTTLQARQALEAVAAAGDVPPVIIVSSGTNDLSSVSLRAEAERILAIAGPDRCVVWADVVRPDAFGDGMTAANDALAKALSGHANVVRVAWTALIAQHPDWLSGDGIHPGQTGNMARAKAFADAVFSCSPLDPDAPVAAKQYLPPSAFLSPGGHTVPGVRPLLRIVRPGTEGVEAGRIGLPVPGLLRIGQRHANPQRPRPVSVGATDTDPDRHPVPRREQQPRDLDRTRGRAMTEGPPPEHPAAGDEPGDGRTARSTQSSTLGRRTLLAGGLGLGVLALGAAGVASGVVPVPARLHRAFQDTGPDGTIPAVPPGTVRLEQVTSAARGQEVGFYTAVPDGYGDGSGLPVCLVLHGATATTARYEAFGFGQFLTAAVQAGVPPFVLAGADGGRTFWAGDGAADDPQRMLREEIPAWCEARGFDTTRMAAYGWSMGGHGTLLAAERHPGWLLAAAALSPAVSPGDEVFTGAGSLEGSRTGIWCGTADPLYPSVRKLVAVVPGGPAVASFSPGAHTRGFWNRVTPDAFAFVGRALA